MYSRYLAKADLNAVGVFKRLHSPLFFDVNINMYMKQLIRVWMISLPKEVIIMLIEKKLNYQHACSSSLL